MKFKSFLLLFFIASVFSFAGIPERKKLPFKSPESEHWADSVIASMSPAQRIAQLFMVAAWSNKDSVHIKEIEKLIKDWEIGGLIFFQGGPVRQALEANYYQSISKVPMLIGMDAEWGLAMRIDSTPRFPRQMTLSAINDDSVVYKMGSEIARECKRLGVHINFAPDADINNNPANPIIGSRSFSDDREVVYRRSLMYMNALQDQHILATAKHFPGHGNADTDSHLALPLISQSAAQMDSMELYPFKKLINDGLTGIMVAHLDVPSLDSTPQLPSTLSKQIVTGLLKNGMGFDGLIFTDALNMKGVSSCYKPGVLDKLALVAGNDVLLYSEDVRKAIDEITLAIQNNEISQEEVDARVKKVLMVKYWCGLNNYKPIDTTNLVDDLNDAGSKLLQRDLFSRSITLLKNQDSLLPFSGKDTLKIASVVIGDKKFNAFQKQLALYQNIDLYAEDKDAPLEVFNTLFKFMENYDYVILSLHGTTMKAQTNYGIPTVANTFIDSVLGKYKTVFVDFGNAYTLSRFKNLQKAKSIVIAYEDFPLTHSLTAQIVMGGKEANGKLPVDVMKGFNRNSGMASVSDHRLEYTIPEAVGIPSKDLNGIDSIVAKAIGAGAMPGCQVMIVKDNKVIYQKAFGTKTYNSTDSIRTTDLYDIASITKIAGTALATMRLVEQKKMDIHQPLSRYFPKLKNTNKRSLVIKDILTHQSGLPAWIPFYQQTIKDSSIYNTVYCSISDPQYCIRIADNLFMSKAYEDSVIQWILKSPVNEKGKYVYSDLGPILMKMAIEKTTARPFDRYLDENFYKPLGLRLTFQPRLKYMLSEIVPTEKDTVFRKQIIQGDVHDPTAAILGGISGNAGLFGTSNDLAVIMQMLLNDGTYGGQRYFKSATVDLFTTRAFNEGHNRRGLFFDKPEPDSSKPSPCSKYASPLTFGHQGFTGTCVWADPKYNLIYVFLSNRVYPDATKDTFSKMNVRIGIQDVIYKAILKSNVKAE